MTHTFTTHDGARHFDAALVADDAVVSDPLIFSTVAFPILRRTEDLLAEQSIRFVTLSAIIDRFRFGYFTGRPLHDLFRTRERQSHAVEIAHLCDIFS